MHTSRTNNRTPQTRSMVLLQSYVSGSHKAMTNLPIYLFALAIELMWLGALALVPSPIPW